MKNSYLVFLFFSVFNFLNAQTTAIPDVNFEQKLITLGIDTNGLTGNILNSDALAVTTLTLSGDAITNLTGLEAFVNIVTLNLGSNQFATVPLSTLTLLQELVFDQNVVLTSLDLSNNVNLKKLDIRANGGTNTAPITTIDLSNNLQLEYIHIYNFKLLQNVIYPNTNTVKYVYLLMFANINVDFSGYSSLETLTLSVNFSNVLTISVVLPNNQTTLKSASFQGGNIVNPNFSNALGLTFLSMQQTNTQTLQLPITNTLKTIRISGHKIDNVNFANASDLEDLSITNKVVNIPLNIDISQNVLLKRLNANDNYMTSINVTQNILLQQINVSSNQLTDLNLNQNVLLEDLNASYNLLPIVNLAQNVLLEDLQLRNNVIPTLNLTANIVLVRADISNNLFTTTGLDLTQNVLLNYFKASFNQIESLNISQNAVLINLILDHNLFSGTAILDQFYILRLNNDGIYGGTLNVSFNKLSGVIPNYTSLFHLGSPTINSWTRYFTFYFDNNNFEFGHFENQHPSYLSALTTFSPMPIVLPVMTAYHYAPQAKVNLVETPTILAGTPITLTTTVSGAQNHYKWFKNNVAIVGAPDSPSFVIVSANPCDNGVYHCEIRSDLVPFENANPPGTNGKNLLLVRNNITLTVTPVVSSCPTLTLPINGATNVPINTAITWVDSPNACSYTLTIGTTSGGTQILNNVNVGDVNFYNLSANLPINAPFFVTITPNYQNGPTPSCTEQSFTTGTLVAALPTCVTAMDYPAINAINIPVNQNFSWIPVANASGYTVIMGTTPGGSQIAGTTNLTTNVFNPTADLPEGVPVYLTITPFNADGNAVGCSSFQFNVEVNATIPSCPVSYSIANGATNVSVNSSISWPAISSQTTYRIKIGTTLGGSDFVNNFFLNNISFYSSSFGPGPFAYSTTYYVTITTENQNSGNQTTCAGFQFTTQAAPASVPNCTTLVSPPSGSTNVAVNADISWNAVANATGYIISVVDSSGTSFIQTTLGNVLTYNPSTDFAQNTTYSVTITPLNNAGSAVGCASQSFTTETIVTIPNCTTLVSPSSGSTNVAINSDISWNAVANATGYSISVVDSSGTSFIQTTLGNVLTYNPSTDFAQNTTYSVTITPLNNTGSAVGCASQSFTTETIVTIPNCTTLVSPSSGSTDVAINSDISWNAVANATGYFISYGTNNAANNIENSIDVGNILSYNPPTDFPDDAQIFVVITPYNILGNAIGCNLQYFQTEIITIEIPNQILFIPSFFTPNGDGFNDVWQIEDPKNEVTLIYIFDRFGKLLKTISGSGNWTGNFANKKIVADDYWFLIQKKTGEVIQGHFSLIR